MKIGILKFGQVDPYVLDRVKENLIMVFPKTTCKLMPETLTLPQEAFNEERKQYRSDIILNQIVNYAQREKTVNRVLGVVDVDIFVQQLNYVFGEAERPGKAALISLWRLRPEFHKKPANMELFVERSTKEAVHELGHTLGLGHCDNPFCVMYFSNSIFDTDRKQSLFCHKCQLKIETVRLRSRRTQSSE